MKYITFAIPSYNSEGYMRRCIDSLLPGGDDVEILIINDGSTDKTGEIADEYEKKYPGICKAIQKENGGHGSGVNKGLELATGVYYKVVDSDDWLDKDAYPIFLNKLKELVDERIEPDLILANYLYDHLDEDKIKHMRMNQMFPANVVFTWNQTKIIPIDRYLMMHNLYYRTEKLRSTGIVLPEHTFYVDGAFASIPLFACTSIYYMNLDLYHYYIGRSDQSVNTDLMCKRVDQYIRVQDMIEKQIDFKKVAEVYPKLGRYLYQYFSLICAICTALLDMIGDKEALAKRDKLWDDMSNYDHELYKEVRNTLMGRMSKLPPTNAASLFKIAKKIFKFS